jgi:hypothetical protein
VASVRSSDGPGLGGRYGSLEGALERGELDLAITLASKVVEDHGHIDLATALKFLPLVAVERSDEFHGWALRWLARWMDRRSQATIAQAAEVATDLADLPFGPASALTLVREAAFTRSLTQGSLNAKRPVNTGRERYRHRDSNRTEG